MLDPRRKLLVRSAGGSPIQRANEAMMNGQTIDDFDLPQAVKQRIRDRRYSAAEINAAYAKVRNETT